MMCTKKKRNETHYIIFFFFGMFYGMRIFADASIDDDARNFTLMNLQTDKKNTEDLK